jgi:nifR3 family TIM-barrel protein
MVTARPLLEGREKTDKMAEFGPGEHPRSLQLYGVDPATVGKAVERLVGEGRADHIDLNFGCPVRKVTSKGGGAALPLKPRLVARIIRAAVVAAGKVPVTVKFRLGIDEGRLTYLTTGRVAEEEGSCAVGLHARTAAQLYDGIAHWDAIGELKSQVRIPVLGNGDIWEAGDALRMMRQTACDGVIVGRGCLGRPWLFRDLANVFDGQEPENPPCLGEVAKVMREHARLLAEWSGEALAMRAFRTHAGWYIKGFHGSAAARQALMQVESLAGLHQVIDDFDLAEPFPPTAMRVRRGKRSGTQRVCLPAEFLTDDLRPPGPEAEAHVSGG